jgi:L-2-hydroxyglutarate oxidase LhgO
MVERYNFDAVVVGSGVIGLSSALELQLQGKKVLLVEKNNYPYEETSSRNSGVIHSGIYYQKNSLKKSFCIRGNYLLYKFCNKYDVPFKKTEKLIVASKDEEQALTSIYENGLKNGLGNQISLVEGIEIRDMEPNISKNISQGIHVKSTGIIDQPSLCQKLRLLFENHGGQITLNTFFYNYENEGNFHISFLDTLGEKFQVKSRYLILCPGLHSFEVGSMIGKVKNIVNFRKIKYVKGHYYKLNNKTPPFNKLIYPVPDKLGLGIHYTLDINGYGKFGPDTVVVNELNYSFDHNLKEKFFIKISKYLSNINIDDLSEDYTGIRPKLDIDKSFIDFSILESKDHGIDNLLFLQGFESPGLTSSLAISEYIAKKLI